MSLLDRNREILARADDMRPVEPRLREIFERGKREQLLEGRDAQGRPFAPVKASTARTRGGSGPPLAPRGEASTVVKAHRVALEWLQGAVRVVSSWPGVPWIGYHVAGTGRMPRRDPSGFREEDKAEALRAVRDWIMQGRR